MKKLLLIDGNAIFHRAFHSMPPLINDKGEYTNAIYGFTKMLFDIIQKEKPEYLVCAFDHRDKTFRHTEFTEYKATRSAPPPELYPQLPALFDLLKVFQIPIFQTSGFEADDIIGTLATQAELIPELRTIILTGDKDAFQLVTERTHVITPIKGILITATYDTAEVKAKMGLRPDQIVDYKALRGDASDNIPGVKGIGEKQACEMLSKYDNLDNIYAHISELSAGQQKKLTENRDTAYLSQKMATIIRDMPIRLDLEACQLHTLEIQPIREALHNLGFQSLEKNINQLATLLDAHQQAEKQPSLF